MRGSVEPLLKVLAASHVRELLSHEPSLEELFLAYYEDGEAAWQPIEPAARAPIEPPARQPIEAPIEAAAGALRFVHPGTPT